jgi:hypothetical protein
VATAKASRRDLAVLAVPELRVFPTNSSKATAIRTFNEGIWQSGWTWWSWWTEQFQVVRLASWAWRTWRAKARVAVRVANRAEGQGGGGEGSDKDKCKKHPEKPGCQNQN